MAEWKRYKGTWTPDGKVGTKPGRPMLSARDAVGDDGKKNRNLRNDLRLFLKRQRNLKGLDPHWENESADDEVDVKTSWGLDELAKILSEQSSLPEHRFPPPPPPKTDGKGAEGEGAYGKEADGRQAEGKEESQELERPAKAATAVLATRTPP